MLGRQLGATVLLLSWSPALIASSSYQFGPFFSLSGRRAFTSPTAPSSTSPSPGSRSSCRGRWEREREQRNMQADSYLFGIFLNSHLTKQIWSIFIPFLSKFVGHHLLGGVRMGWKKIALAPKMLFPTSTWKTFFCLWYPITFSKKWSPNSNDIPYGARKPFMLVVCQKYRRHWINKPNRHVLHDISSEAHSCLRNIFLFSNYKSAWLKSGNLVTLKKFKGFGWPSVCLPPVRNPRSTLSLSCPCPGNLHLCPPKIQVVFERRTFLQKLREN